MASGKTDRVQEVIYEPVPYESKYEYGSEEFLERAAKIPNCAERFILINSLDFTKEEDAKYWAAVLSRDGIKRQVTRQYNGYWLIDRQT